MIFTLWRQVFSEYISSADAWRSTNGSNFAIRHHILLTRLTTPSTPVSTWAWIGHCRYHLPLVHMTCHLMGFDLRQIGLLPTYAPRSGRR